MERGCGGEGEGGLGGSRGDRRGEGGQSVKGRGEYPPWGLLNQHGPAAGVQQAECRFQGKAIYGVKTRRITWFEKFP